MTGRRLQAQLRGLSEFSFYLQNLSLTTFQTIFSSQVRFINLLSILFVPLVSSILSSFPLLCLSSYSVLILCLSSNCVHILIPFYLILDSNSEYTALCKEPRKLNLYIIFKFSFYLFTVILCRLPLPSAVSLSLLMVSIVDNKLHVDHVVLRELNFFDSVRSPVLEKSHGKLIEHLSILNLEAENSECIINAKLKLIEFPAKTWEPIDQFKLGSFFPKHMRDSTSSPFMTYEILNLNCARLYSGIKSLRIRQNFITFELPLTSYDGKIKPYSTRINSAKQEHGLIKELVEIYRNRNLTHLAGFMPTPQPHTNLDMENISIRLIDSDTNLSLHEAIDDEDSIIEITTQESTSVFTMYKTVDKKVKPVPTSFPQDCYVHRGIPEDPLLTLPTLSFHPPMFTPTKKITNERLKILKINEKGFLSTEEEKLFIHIMVLNEDAIAFEDAERGTFKESYFSPYIIPTVPHRPWEHRNIPIPPGLREKVMDVLKLKMDAGVYEQSNASYRSRWFVVLKKNGKLRIVHDLQPLNKVTIRDAGMLPIVDDFVDSFAGRQCYTVFDLFWGFDARKIHPRSRDLTAFMTPLGLLQITSLPTGFTNSPAEFQKCMAIILKDEIPTTANIFIDDLPIKGPETQYLDSNGKPEVLSENPGIRRFIWEHAQDVHRIMHRIKTAGATFAANKAQICLPEVLIIGQTCNTTGRSPDTSKVDKILAWPPLTDQKEVRRFLGLCGTVRIWIPRYSEIIRPLTELYRQNTEFIWDERRQAAFNEIKSKIASAPALRPIDYTSDNPVIISVDSSKIAVGMILSQLGDDGKTKYPARYGSLPMDEPASRYSQPKLELFGLYRALRHWRLYIIGVKKLIVEVDAKYIKGMLNEPDYSPNATINRWIQGINLFTFELVHIPAEKHRGPDALSRRPLAEGEPIEVEDDSWLDNIALITLTSPSSTSKEVSKSE